MPVEHWGTKQKHNFKIFEVYMKSSCSNSHNFDIHSDTCSTKVIKSNMIKRQESNLHGWQTLKHKGGHIWHSFRGIVQKYS